MGYLRPDGGPANLEELLNHYQKMATEHHALFVRLRASADSRSANNLAMSVAYNGAAHELAKMMDYLEAQGG